MASKQDSGPVMPFPKYVGHDEAGISILVTTPEQVKALGKGWKDHEPCDPELVSDAAWPRKATLQLGGRVITILSAEQYEELRDHVTLMERPPAPEKSKNFRHSEMVHERMKLVNNLYAHQKYPGPVMGLARITHPSGMEAWILPEQARYFPDWEGLPKGAPAGDYFNLHWAADEAAAEAARAHKAEQDRLERERKEQATLEAARRAV